MHIQLLGPEQGLSQSSVLSIHQDSLGFIWIGTRDGLNEYNGTNIKVYRHVLSDSSSIAGNHINDIENGKNGNIWIAHNKGVSLFDRRRGVFRNYEVGRYSNNEMRSISVINGRIWSCGWTGIYLYDEEKDLFTKPDIHAPNADVFDASVSKIVLSPQKDEYWIATTTRGLFRYNHTKNEITRRQGKPGEMIRLNENERIEDILFHPNGKAYVATYHHGVYECDLTGKPLRHWSSSGKGTYYSPYNNVRSLALDKNGKIWIGSFQGIGLLDPVTGELVNINLSHGFTNIGNASIRSLLVDKNGSLWIGTYHDGLFLYDDYLSRFKTHYIHTSNSHDSHNIVSAFANKNGILLTGTENGYLLEYDESHNLLKTSKLESKEGNHMVIKSLYYDENKDVLWIGTLRDGLYKIEKGRTTSVGLEKLGVINHIVKESEYSLWLLSDRGKGLNLYNTLSGEMESFPARDKLYALTGKSQGNHLFKTDSGKYLLSTTGSGLIAFENKPECVVERILPDVDDVNHVFVLADTCYVSTNGNGLFTLNRDLEVIKNFTTGEGLQNNTVFNTMSIDGEIWASCINGLSRLTGREFFVNYHVRNGFPLSEINKGAYLQIGNSPDPFVIGGKDAWISFHPQRVYKNPYKPSVYLSGIKINNRPLSSIPDFHHFDILRPGELRLKHDQTTLTFEFAGLNYLIPENNNYKFILEGFDNDWRYTGQDGQAEYSKIPAGNYLLKIHASNNDGVWSDELVIPVIVRPPWWLSPQAIILYIFLLFITIWLIRSNALRKVELKHNIQLKELEKQKLQQIHNMKVKYFTDISHEIRTPLMLILSPVEEMLEESSLKPRERKKMSNIQYHGRNLLQLVNQLLEINRVESKKETLHEVPLMLKNFLGNVDSSFRSLAIKNGITWRTDMSEVTEQTLLIDKDKMEKILMNLLSNAFKHTPKGGTVLLLVKTFHKENDQYSLLIEVEDTGSGIAPEQLPYIFDRFFKGDNKNIPGSGIGLSLVKTIVEDLMNGTINVQSTLDKGSIFSVRLDDIKPCENSTVMPAEEFVLPSEIASSLEREEEEILCIDEKRDKNHSLLLVEDNITLLNTLSHKLSKSFNVVNVTSAEEASKVLQEKDIDVVISDIMLPGKSGNELCAEIKSAIVTSHIPVILLTAIQQEEVKMESLGLGADDYLTKPFSYKELELRVNNILRRQEQLRELYKKDLLPEKDEMRFNKYDNELLKRIDEQIEKHLSNFTYSIEDLSADVALSRVHLYRKVKKLLGVSPSRYIRDYRLKKAISILSSEEIRISELADRVGFQDANYFLKCFKEKFGVSPREYSKPKA
ncbi:ATP-binding protein [Proteiniphilum sp. X52]|uniref:ATP-binding protein n=1 Tax=Proteiniphilum sp. X52 TaxID=2382159 RepID=UPI00210159C4|nr:ATP-binding protein [Proteiniphilum sp. X52]